MILWSRNLFIKIEVDKAPEMPGVYALWQDGALIYYGSSEVSIRGRLRRHLAGYEGACTQRATHYQAEITHNPVYRERRLLEEYEAKYGRLPRCNDQHV